MTDVPDLVRFAGRRRRRADVARFTPSKSSLGSLPLNLSC